MSYKTRQEYEDAMMKGQAFARLEGTADYAASFGAWLEEQLASPSIINIDDVKDPALLEKYYWMMMGRKEMLYALREQIIKWRQDSKLNPSDTPDQT